MLLFNVSYYTVDGKRLASYDRDVPLTAATAGPGEVLRCECTNGDPRDVRWIDSRGEQITTPTWVR